MRVISGLLITASFALPAHANPDWPETFRKAVIAPADAPTPIIAYEQVIRTDTGEESYRLAYDGSAPEGERLKLVSTSDEYAQYSKDILEAYAEDDPSDIWCDDMAEQIKGDVKQVEDEDGMMVFTYQPTDQGADGDERKVIEKSDARMMIDPETGKPRLITYKLKKPFTVVPFVAKVHNLDVRAECTPTEVGRSYSSKVAVNLSLTVMGKDQIDNTVETIENLRFPGLSAE